MNCRPGNLAIVLHAIRGNQGRVVRVASRSGLPWIERLLGPCWWVEAVGAPFNNGKRAAWAVDAWLRPLAHGDTAPNHAKSAKVGGH